MSRNFQQTSDHIKPNKSKPKKARTSSPKLGGIAYHSLIADTQQDVGHPSTGQATTFALQTGRTTEVAHDDVKDPTFVPATQTTTMSKVSGPQQLKLLYKESPPQKLLKSRNYEDLAVEAFEDSSGAAPATTAVNPADIAMQYPLITGETAKAQPRSQPDQLVATSTQLLTSFHHAEPDDHDQRFGQQETPYRCPSSVNNFSTTTTCNTKLFSEEPASSLGVKRPFATANTNPVDPDGWLRNWCYDNPGQDLPSWTEVCGDNSAKAACVFRHRLKSFGVTLHELCLSGLLQPGPLDMLLSAYSVDELDDALNRIRIVKQTAHHSVPPTASPSPEPTHNAHHTGSSYSAAIPVGQPTAGSASTLLPAQQTGVSPLPAMGSVTTSATLTGTGIAAPLQPTFAMTSTVPTLRTLDSTSVARFTDDLRKVLNTHTSVTVGQCIAATTGPALGIRFLASQLIQPHELDPGSDHYWVRTMSPERFAECLRACYRDADAASTHVVQRLAALRHDFGSTLQNDTATKYVVSVTAILADAPPGSYNGKAAVNALMSGIIATRDERGRPRSVSSINAQLHARFKACDPPLQDTNSFLVAAVRAIDIAIAAWMEYKVWVPQAPPQQAAHADTRTLPSTATPRIYDAAAVSADNECDGKCYGCGRTYKLAGKRCPHCVGHPDRNLADIPFADAPIYQDIIALLNNGRLTHPVLPLKTRADLTPLTSAHSMQISAAKAALPSETTTLAPQYHGGGGRDGGGRGGFGGRHNSRGGGNGRGSGSHYGPNTGRGYNQHNGPRGTMVLSALQQPARNITFPSVLITAPTVSLTVACLFDTGALQDNYVSRELAAWLQQNKAGEISVDDSCHDINLAGTDLFVTSAGSVVFDVSFYNEVSREIETISSLKATILDSKYPLIIGRPLIRKHKLARKVLTFFEDEDDKPGEAHAPQAITPPLCTQRNSLATGLDGASGTRWEWWRQHAGDSQPSQIARNQLSLLVNVKSKQELLPDCEPDIDYIEWPDDPFDCLYSGESSCVDKITIEGSLPAQKKIRKLCEQYADIFAESVRAEPANVPPMEIKVDPAKWQVPRNRGPPRPQTNAKCGKLKNK
jgi:hypothetical protein